MEKNPHLIFAFLLLSYGILDSKVIDVHISTPKEYDELEKMHREIQSERDLKIVNDKDSTPEQKEKALDRLIANGEVG